MGLVISILVIWITNVRQLLAHQWNGQTQRQFIIVIKIIITISVVHFPNELNQKPLTVSQLVLQLQIFQSLVSLNQLLSLA